MPAIDVAPQPADDPAAVPMDRAALGWLPSASGGGQHLDLAALVGAWDELSAMLRASGKGMLATALTECTPVAVSDSGAIDLRLDDPNDMYVHAFESGRDALLSALRARFRGVTRIALVPADVRGEATAPRERLTADGIRADRTAALRRKDATLAAAIDALDLELLD